MTRKKTPGVCRLPAGNMMRRSLALSPEKVTLVLGDLVYVAKDQLPPALRNRLVRLAAFQNPEFYRAQAMRMPTFGKPRVIHCAEETTKHLALPRGCLE